MIRLISRSWSAQVEIGIVQKTKNPDSNLSLCRSISIDMSGASNKDDTWSWKVWKLEVFQEGKGDWSWRWWGLLLLFLFLGFHEKPLVVWHIILKSLKNARKYFEKENESRPIMKMLRTVIIVSLLGFQEKPSVVKFRPPAGNLQNPDTGPWLPFCILLKQKLGDISSTSGMQEVS